MFTHHPQRLGRLQWLVVLVWLVLLSWLAWAPLGASAQTVYRCGGAEGVVVFQQMPCAGAGQRLEVPPINVAQAYRPDPELQRSYEVRRAIGRGVVIAGMTEAEVQQVLGSPRSVRRSVTPDGVTEQLGFRLRDGSRAYVYLRDGVAESASTYSGTRHPRP
jgi:Domain of unknown function (DUF4124)